MDDLLAEAACAHPERPAARVAGRAIAYRDLDARATDLARRLSGAGVRPGQHVGIA
jgi:non-ribosomal peptide synthetase component E (peptide arylation enzyme)